MKATTMTTKGGGIGDRYSVRWSTTPTSAHPGAAVKFAHFGGDTSPVATVTAAPLHAEFRLTATVTDGQLSPVPTVTDGRRRCSTAVAKPRPLFLRTGERTTGQRHPAIIHVHR